MVDPRYRSIRAFLLDNQTRLNKLVFILVSIAAITLSCMAYDNLNHIQSSIDQLTQDTVNSSSSAAIINIHHSISESITELLAIVVFSTIFGGVFVWKLIKHIQISQLLANHNNDGICITDKKLRVLSINQEFCRLVNIPEYDLQDQTLYKSLPSLFNPEKPLKAFMTEIVESATDNLSPQLQLSLCFSPESSYGARFCVLSVRDITSVKKSETNLRNLAYTDDLTNLPNRAHLLSKMDELITAYESTGIAFALFFLDLDGFKDINDSLGHDAGDQFLIRMAQRLENYGRHNDFVARLGGDEFCILMEDFQDLAMLEAFSERLLKCVAIPVTLNGRSIKPQTSIGYALYPTHADSKEGLLQASDMAMYKAKNSGKHRAVLFNPDITHSIRDRLNLEHDLRIAFEEEQFVLFYQPQVSLQNGHMTGVEALIRWQHPQHGMVFPDQFIDAIERLGLMETLGDWVMLESCKQQRRWHDVGIDLNVAVNISGSHFQSGNLINSTLNALTTAGIAPERLELEITENVMQVADTTVENFKALRDLGVKIAIDDFGTGYSSLGSLRTLPVDHLKVDRMFLRDVLVDEKQAVIISTIIGMARALGLKVIVEGVETMDHILLLESLGCNIVQGYYFSKPIAADRIPNLYHNGFHSPKPRLQKQHF